jgi:cytochrome c peroxidase
LVALLLPGAIALAGCGRDQARSDAPTKPPAPHTVTLPADVVAMPVPADNPLTVEGVELGRRLFYDPILSGDNTRSCSSCHIQARGFTDGKPKSRGVRDQEVRRNSMALVNLAWSAPYFWDGRAATLEELVPIPIQEPTELDQKMDDLVAELRAHPDYPARFERAFPGKPIAEDTIARAVAQFLRTLVSFDSPMDRIDRGELTLTAAQQRGQELLSIQLPLGAASGRRDFCDACHTHAAGLSKPDGMGMFTDGSFKNNGIEAAEDRGRGEISRQSGEDYRFKVPTIRNVTVTGPYMHDGRFTTLKEVVAHYNEHVGASADDKLQLGGAPVRLALSPSDVDAIVASLELFTDESFLRNPAFADPFAGGEGR